MALIQCPECGKEISDMAVECPNCGYPINEYETEFKEEYVEIDEKQSGFGIASFVLAAIALAMGMCGFLTTVISFILLFTSFALGTIGLFVKRGKHGLAIAGNIISFILLFYILF